MLDCLVQKYLSRLLSLASVITATMYVVIVEDKKQQSATDHKLRGLYLGLTWERMRVFALTAAATWAAMAGVECPNSTHFSRNLFSIVAS